MILWYDKTGKPFKDIELDYSNPRWRKAMAKVDALLGDVEYKVVQQDFTKDKTFWVSTVWLGIDHDFAYGARPGENTNEPNPYPIIFETMVFDKRPENQITNDLVPGHTISPSLEQDRYCTEAEAIMGHAAMLKKYQALE